MSRTFDVFKDNRGFSLVQTLVAVSIMGGLSLGTMTMLDTAQKNTRRNELRTVAGQVTNQVQDYLNSKEICGKNITNAFAMQSISGDSLEGSTNGFFKSHVDSDGNQLVDENGNPVPDFVILEAGVKRPDGLRVENIEVFYENIVDFAESDEWDKKGNGRVVIRMSYCEKGGMNCPDEARKSIDRAIPLKEIYARVDGANTFQEAICSSSQDGILKEAQRMVDEVQRQVCQLAFANAALNGDMTENPDCGQIVDIKDSEDSLEAFSNGSGIFTPPPAMDLKNCQFRGVVPGTMRIAISGAGGGGYGSDKNSCGTGGKAGDFLTQSIFVPMNESCSYTVGEGGDPGHSGSSVSSASGGETGGTTTFKCGTIVDLSVEGGGTGSKNNGCTYGGAGENSEFYKFYHGEDGGGGRGAKAKEYDANPGTLGGGGGGGAEKKGGKSSRRGGKGGDGAILVTWKEFTVQPKGNIHDCPVCEPGQTLENGECQDICSGYGEVYDEGTNSCKCSGNTIRQGDSCVSCSTSYASGAESNGSSCYCPNGGNRQYCDGAFKCMPYGMSCSNDPHGPHGPGPVEIE